MAAGSSANRPPVDAAIDVQPWDVLHRVSDGFVALDRNWRYTYLNRQAAALFGRTPADLIGKHIWTEFPEGVGQPFHRAYEKAMAEQVFIEMEHYYAPWDRWFENRIYPSADGLTIFFREVTERKHAEAAARENEELLRIQNRVLELTARRAPLDQILSVLVSAIEALSPEMYGSVLLLDPDGLHVRHGRPRAFRRNTSARSMGKASGRRRDRAARRPTAPSR